MLGSQLCPSKLVINVYRRSLESDLLRLSLLLDLDTERDLLGDLDVGPLLKVDKVLIKKIVEVLYS